MLAHCPHNHTSQHRPGRSCIHRSQAATETQGLGPSLTAFPGFRQGAGSEVEQSGPKWHPNRMLTSQVAALPTTPLHRPPRRMTVRNTEEGQCYSVMDGVKSTGLAAGKSSGRQPSCLDLCHVCGNQRSSYWLPAGSARAAATIWGREQKTEDLRA